MTEFIFSSWFREIIKRLQRSLSAIELIYLRGWEEGIHSLFLKRQGIPIGIGTGAFYFD